MKLRRAMAAAAATAVIAPLALLSAPAAYATADEPSATPTATSPEETKVPETPPTPTDPPTETKEPETPSTPTDPPTETKEPETPPAPTETPTATATAPEPTASEPEETQEPEPGEPGVCKDTKVDVSISGLPGKIEAGSGWHKFSLNVLNNSDSTLNDLDFFAGASPDKNGEELFTSKQVKLQAWNPDAKTWENLNEGGYAVGYVGYTDKLKPDYEVNIPLRLNVAASAPVGSGFSLGATIYGDSEGECTGFGSVSYKFQIVSAGTDTDGTKPQEGGKAPITNEKPKANTPEVTGSLAETGSSSALPTIGLAGGLAVVAGAGAMFVVRRRKAGAEA
ncbi:LPXTG cell wall anchor domain-containing protein [Streptomyces sp. TRM68367]|uniref:LPXTG cell wall anchor domain-containing protein n=1 Tax=Streptomyces sp. TRM68367 TaxID=2758415 RepID=UPI00165B28AF|nr:LPXTG cell wall anchor domain-containing protein [Streptomyces sp. TRM68367]MBC9725746.1 LPXTG cell wall anchor domain-containing protein [Streptomyces sp. TRM68367]